MLDVREDIRELELAGCLSVELLEVRLIDMGNGVLGLKLMDASDGVLGLELVGW